MRKFLVNVQFLGKNYSGFQINGNQKTIQGEIEKSLKELFNQEVKIDGCSRTDSGVSAKDFFFTFCAETKLPADRVCFKLNRFLPNDIQCQNSIEVENNFILRDNIKTKTYEYTIYTGQHIQPIYNRFAVFCEGELNLQKMIDCAKILIGKHNFKSFCNYNPDISTYDREITDIKIIQQDNLIKFYLTANGFLYNMVRILVGTLIECGKDKMNQNDILNLFKEKDRSKNQAKTMTPKGLMLYKVEFNEKII